MSDVQTAIIALGPVAVDSLVRLTVEHSEVGPSRYGEFNLYREVEKLGNTVRLFVDQPLGAGPKGYERLYFDY